MKSKSMKRESGLLAWASSGAMFLTGPRYGSPLAAPAGVAAAMADLADELRVETAYWGTPVVVDGPALLAERSAFTKMSRNGDTSVGGSAQFMRAADGWIVLNLARPEDTAALPALLGSAVEHAVEDAVEGAVEGADWPAIAAGIARLSTSELLETAALLGIPLAAAGFAGTAGTAGTAGIVRAEPVKSPSSELHLGHLRQVRKRPLVVDLTSLWAGPLLGNMLKLAGARVIKVEGRNRPDGARKGPAEFFDLLNHGKECLTVDFNASDDLGFLRKLLKAADLVLEGSRPRVMEQSGIDPFELADAGVNWLSITGYGRSGRDAMRVGFGDDSAVAGGLWLNNDPPNFVADAVADPLAGLAAAVLAAHMLASSRAAVAEVPLCRAAAWVVENYGFCQPHGDKIFVQGEGNRWNVKIAGQWHPVALPRHRPVLAKAVPVGHHNMSLRAEFAERS